MGFEPTRAETNGLSIHHLNHSAIFVHNRCDQTVFLYVNLIDKFPFLRDTSIQHNQNHFYLVLSEFLIVVVIMCANHSKGFLFEPGRIIWPLFSTMSSAVF